MTFFMVSYSCQREQHDKCIGKQSPPKNMLGGWTCSCDCHAREAQEGT